VQVNKVVSSDFTVQEVVDDVCDSVGLTAAKRNTSDLALLTGEGYVRAAIMPARRAIEPLMGSYAFDAAEYDHKINFIQRGGAVQTTITEDEIAAHEYGSETPNKMDINIMNEVDFPREFVLSFISSSNDYEPGSARSIRMSTDSKNIQKVQFPIVMSYAQAKQRAEILHNTMFTERTRYNFISFLKYLYLAPSDVITADGFKMRIDAMSIKQNLLQIQGPAENDANYTSSATTDDPVRDGQTIDIVPPTAHTLLDIPILQDSHNAAGFYIAANGYGATAWTGATLYVSIDGGSTYQEASTISNESVMGSATDALAEQTYYPGTIDDLNTVNIILGSTNHILTNATELQVFSGTNWAALGVHGAWEIIGFKTAALQGDGSYTLSGLLRGINGTEWAMGGHAISDIFVMLNTDNLIRFAHGNNVIGIEQSYKVITKTADPNIATGENFTSQAVGLKPYSPEDVVATRDGSNNITITWKRRSRINHDWEDGQDVPLGENSEEYEIDIMDGASVKRAITGLSSQTYTYTIGDQTTDWGGAKNPVSVRVYQISAIVDRGYTREVSI
jgi:hypothetical protein